MIIKCDVCGREFDKPSRRNQHVKDAHNTKEPIMTSIPTPAIKATAPTDATRVGRCVAVGPDRIIIASANTVEWADKIVAALTPAAIQAVAPIPAHLREFVEAIAHRFDAIDRETDDEFCKGCSGLSVWDKDSRQSHTHHRPDCIVLRAEALLAAIPAQAQAQQPTVDVKAIHSAVLAVQCDPAASKEKRQGFLTAVHRAAAEVSKFAAPAVPVAPDLASLPKYQRAACGPFDRKQEDFYAVADVERLLNPAGESK